MSYKVKRKQPNSKMCLVCGLKNPYGLKTSYYELENNELLGVFSGMEEHQSYPGRLHGGIAAAILDESIGRAIMIPYDDAVWGVTIDFNIRFKKPLPLSEELRVIGRITKETNRYFEGSGEIILSNGDIAATASGKYLKLPIEKIADFDVDEQEWRVVYNEHDPIDFEI